MNVVAIIQARMGSTRLPGKVLKDIAGKSMLARVVERTLLTPGLNDVVVATTNLAHDDAIVDEGRALGVPVFRGSESDVLDRYYWAAQQLRAEVIIRITSDCPLIDPGVIAKVLCAFRAKGPDYASNTLLQRTYPRGLDTEVFTAAALKRAWQEARDDYYREHVTPYIYENQRKFRLLSVEAEGSEPYGDYRWTVDYPEDMTFVRAVYENLGPLEFCWRDVLKLLQTSPSLKKLNQNVETTRTPFRAKER